MLLMGSRPLTVQLRGPALCPQEITSTSLWAAWKTMTSGEGEIPSGFSSVLTPWIWHPLTCVIFFGMCGWFEPLVKILDSVNLLNGHGIMGLCISGEQVLYVWPHVDIEGHLDSKQGDNEGRLDMWCLTLSDFTLQTSCSKRNYIFWQGEHFCL